MKQVNKDHYDFAHYCYPDRWASYWHQLKEITDLNPQSILEVGAGDEVVKNYITKMIGSRYTTVDVAEDLHPDVIGSIDALPFPDASYDMTVAFEVLEHLPFEKFPVGIKELARVSKKHVIISVPHFGPAVRFLLKLPFLPLLKFAFKIPFPKQHVFNGQHYWELGKKGYSVARIKNELQNYFIIKKDFVPFDNQYHHFFVLEKK